MVDGRRERGADPLPISIDLRIDKKIYYFVLKQATAVVLFHFEIGLDF